MANSADSPEARPARWFARLLRLLRPSHQHSAFSATLLLMTAVMLSRVIGYVREAYIAYAFGAGSATDAYVAGFTIPDWLNYLVAGGTASITFVSIYTRFVAEKKEAEAQKTFSVIITVMTAVLGVGILLTEVFAPLLYNAAIIAGGVLLSRRLGIASLAYGAVAGSFLGPFLINAIGAARIGTGYSISFDVRNPAFREWVRLSIPLMLGVSLVTADDWILRYFASGAVGDITRLNYAKKLFAVPIAVLGQATSQASLPFFAKLFGEKRLPEFAETVNGSIYRIVAASLLATSLMIATATPLIDLVYRRGRFLFSDSQETALYFFWFSLSLCFWSAQGLYSRAFYAAGNTLAPMVATSLITLASIPMYSALFHKFSTVGLAMASDLGIVANTLALALLLHRRQLVRVSELRWGEIGKAAITAAAAGLLSYRVAHALMVNDSRIADLKVLGLTTVTWAGAVAAGLWLTRSSLPGDLRRRKPTTYPRVAEVQAAETSGGIEP